MGIFSALLCLTAFQLQGRSLGDQNSHELIILCAISFLACSGTMLFNDYHDMDRDRKKGKVLAYTNKETFYWLSNTLLMSVGVLASVFLSTRLVWFVITLVMVSVSIYCVRSYPHPWLPTVLVAFTAATPAFYAITQHFVLNLQNGLALTILVMSTVFGREVLKDIEDREGDLGHKQTLPVVYGISLARKLAALTVFGGSIFTSILAIDWRLKLIGAMITACSACIWH